MSPITLCRNPSEIARLERRQILDRRTQLGDQVGLRAVATDEEVDEVFDILREQGAEILDIGGVRLVNGVEYTFPAMTLGANQYVVVAADPNAFAARYGSGINVVGPAKGKNIARRNNGVQCDPAKLC